MALTKEMLTANDVLAGLNEEQISAITTLSANDEDVVIGKRFGEVYRELDATIEKTTGVKRDGAEKTYNYLERATKAYADKFSDYDTIKGQVASLTEEKTRLEKQIAEGGDGALKGQYESVAKELASTKAQFTELREKYDASEAQHAKAMSDYKIKSEIARAKGGLKIKSDINEAVRKTLEERIEADLMAMNPSVEERDGVETIIFHNEDGSPLNNEKNKLNPYTVSELLEREYSSMDLLEKGSTKGAGGRPQIPTSGNMLASTTRREADDEIHKMLTNEGLVRGTAEYQNRYNTLYTENKVSELPM